MTKTFYSLQALEENPRPLYDKTTLLLLKIVENIIREPHNPKFRILRLDNAVVIDKLIPVIGAMECLFEIGFEEGEECLSLPDTIPLESLRTFRAMLSECRTLFLSPPDVSTQQPVPHPTQQPAPQSTQQPALQPTQQPVPHPTQQPAPQPTQQPALQPTQQPAPQPTQHPEPHSTEQTTQQSIQQLPLSSLKAPMLKQMNVHSAGVLQYEDADLQRRALSLVPLARLAGAVERRMVAVRHAVKTGQIAAGQESDARDLLLLELLHWFKGSFFSWVDAPACTTCHGPTTFLKQVLQEGIRTEVYECGSCHSCTSFPRYNDASKLLQTRRGRCGEWANCFTLFCRALGWDARLVVDLTDHVWTEVFSTAQGRWLHCDPCEDVCDRPLLYEAGWGKYLSYVLAYSCDDVQDVTWRYSSSWKAVLARRTQCSEQELLQAIFTLRAQRQAMLSPARRAFLQRRLIAELIHFLSPVTASAVEQQGRMSGSLAWRLARGEVHETAATAHTWVAGPEQVAALRLTVNYCTARDCYETGHGNNMPGWQNGVFSMQNMFRKEEHDWGYVYLVRTEGSEEGRMHWRFDVSDSGLVVDMVTVHYRSFIKDSGKVQWQLCSGDLCVPLPADAEEMCISSLSGCRAVTLCAVLSGGGGEGWQYAQILRQTRDSSECPLSVEIVLKQQ